MVGNSSREKAIRLFRFLREYAFIRFPYIRDLAQVKWLMWLSELPEHECIFIKKIAENSKEDNSEEVKTEPLIRIRRPKLSEPPTPPPELKPWLKPGWDDPFKEPDYSLEKENSSGKEFFEQDSKRMHLWESWIALWHKWADAERINRKVFEIYNRFHGLLGELQREGERYELILADGILSWSWQVQTEQLVSVYFPIILLPVQLEFDSSIPEFTIRDIGRNIELYTAILREAPLTNPQVLSYLQDDLIRGNLLLHPLEEVDTSGFLRRLAHSLASEGIYLGYKLPPREAKSPCIGRAPLLLLRERAQGYSRTIERILEDINFKDELPSALRTIIGIYYDKDNTRLSQFSTNLLEGGGSDDEKVEQVFFTKPWNREQLHIASRLNQFDCVIVQGPPGTGKTHTIANLIGHLLAQGKSILVTAHTTKALRVLREKIIEPLRPLSVALLDNDLESRKQLEEAVNAICNYLSSYNAADLHTQADRLFQERSELLRKISRLRRDIVEAIESEYRSIVVAGREYTPSQAARFVAEGIGHNDWIPGPLKPNAPLPLSISELIELYRLNSELSRNDEYDLKNTFIDPAQLPKPEEVQKLLSLINKPLPDHRPDWWRQSLDKTHLELLSELAETAKMIGQRLLEAKPWELELVDIGEVGEQVNLYEKLFKEAEELSKYVVSVQDLIISHRPELAKDIPLEEQEQLALNFAEAAKRNKGRIGFWEKLQIRFCSQKQKFIKSVRISSGLPVNEDHFRALAVLAAIERRREWLRNAWEELITQLGGPQLDALGSEPEYIIMRVANHIREWLYFNREQLIPFRTKLEKVGFKWDQVFRLNAIQANPQVRWHAFGDFLVQQVVPALEAQILAIRQEVERRYFAKIIEMLNVPNASRVVIDLKEALERNDFKAYQTAYKRYIELYNCFEHFKRREELLKRLEETAPGWADAIRKRIGIHGNPELPGDPEKAWIWRQLYEEILRRTQVDIQKLQEEMYQCTEKLEKITAEFVKCRAWAYRLEKTTQEQRQALIGWLNTMRRIGKGYGKHVHRLRAEAVRLLSQAKDAVPVWIMPLARVVEQIDPNKTRFDVVIIDEASQCDILGLIALYLGKQVVIVGDHEQVNPEGVGLELDQIKALQDEYLYDIPNRHLYDSKRSIYDIARESFGGVIMLVEHFRCVPEIIQFSNMLCYGGRIRPLRDSSQVPLKPHVVPYRLKGISYNKCNEIEANFIASVVTAMTRHPLYQDKTIGIISMVGDEQAKLIERLLQHLISPQDFIKHRILCGTPPQFQGDERDVVLLSLVDSPRSDHRPLPIRQEDRFKQRFNVATSRARDQLWVVYSLDPKVDLQEGDLRRELIEYANNVFNDPEGFHRMIWEETKKAESPFEREVIGWLLRANYRVRSQVSVGKYRIDIVVEGKNNRVAIECDGERWHTPERIWEDLERQAVLERLGWRFIRIRGSEFYRDPERTMRRVFEELERMGVQPGDTPFESGNKSQEGNYELLNEIIRMANEIEEKELSVVKDKRKQYYSPEKSMP